MSNPQILHGRRSKENISLKDAIAKCKEHFNASSDKTAIALLYSPSACKFAKLVNGILMSSVGEAINLAPVFEARIFNETSELRWLNVLNRSGKAVLISDLDISGIFDNSCNLDYFETLSQQYILWGQGMTSQKNLAEGWSRLGAARIGAMDVPIADITHNQQRVILKVCEYLREVDDHGNVAVVEERLVKLTNFATK
jgi:CRISPR-associated protein (TIGR03984 family)